MQIWEIFLTGLSLSADACAVAMCKGVEMKHFLLRYALLIALCFGLFQALMPLIGWAVASQFAEYITAADHWIAFALLALLGGKMFKDGIDSEIKLELGFKTLIVMSVATSIDALAVGVSFAFLAADILPAVCMIGATTFAVSLFGVFVGTKAGKRFRGKAELAGGVLLFLIGLKILLEHLGALSF